MQTQRDCQAEVLAFLEDPARHHGREVRRIDTHASSVFLVGERALKVKRAVRFPFLDYSTLDRRKAACAAELEVNHPFAPAIYRRVLAITREQDGTLAIGGDGEPVGILVDALDVVGGIALRLVAGHLVQHREESIKAYGRSIEGRKIILAHSNSSCTSNMHSALA